MDEEFILTRIYELCNQNNYSMYMLSKKSGVPLSTISSICTKKRFPSIPTLYKLCTALNINMSDFFLETDSINIITQEDIHLLSKVHCLTIVKRQYLNAYIDALLK